MNIPACNVFGKCGGCQLQHINYQSQLEIKQQKVRDCFKEIAHIDVAVLNTVPSDKIFGYRNKLQLPLREENGVNKIGFFRGNSHDVIEIDDCPLHDDFCKRIIAIIKNWSKLEGVSFYNETTKKGTLKHLVVRKVESRYLIALVATTEKVKGINRLIETLKDNFDHFSLLININKQDNNVVFSDKFITVYGDDKIEVIENGIKYHIGIYSFMQVNDGQKKKLYDEVISCCSVDKDTVVIDGYSGAGVLTAMLSKVAKKVYGVEIIEEATNSAKELAVLNGIDNMYPILGDCGDVLPEILLKEEIKDDKKVLILDPPRKGVDIKVLQSVLKVLPDKIIYISCNPSTLARDICFNILTA